MKIKNILFDFGGVVVTLNPDEAMRRFKALGVSDAEQRLDSYTQQGIFGDLERGKITDEQFRTELSKMAGHDVTWQQCQWAWLGYRKAVPQKNLDTIQRLRSEGYHAVLLSNTNPFMMKWALSDAFDGSGHSLNHYMDAIYMSYECKAMKPDEKFFSTVLASEGITPEETLFLDDGPRNVETASILGINTYLVKPEEDWTEHISEYLNK